MVSNLQENRAADERAPQAADVLLLPSNLFFVRSLELPAGIDSEELPSFVELTLEQISPFTLNQLYYGYYLPEESSRLLVFAAYRKQLAVYEDEEWADAELVLPEFTSLLGLSYKKPTIAFLESELELTAVYWNGKSLVPEKVVSRRRDSDESSDSIHAVREEIRRKLGALPEGVESVVFTNPRPRFHDKNLVFALETEKGEEEQARLLRPVFWSMDVRDKDFLLTVRRTQRQNRYIWTGVMLVFAAFLALAVFEVVLFGGNYLIDQREARLEELQPEVEHIKRQEELARRLEELGGERLLPFEMLGHLNQSRPRSIYFTRVATDGLRSFQIEALTPRSQDVDRYQRLLEQDEVLESVEVRNLRLRARDQLSSFVLVGTFKQGTLTDFSVDRSGETVPATGENSAALEPVDSADDFDDFPDSGEAAGNGRATVEGFPDVPLLPEQAAEGENEEEQR
ncbi:MAG TPA: hypothetical protein VK041_09380 [Opitutales bacterium]|nr:hypothetical protein [Opitutales bacterium]